MTTVADLAAWMEGFAPRRLAEPWDNVGLLWGDPGSTISKVMTCLTVTPETADEAIEGGAGAIVSHHPILFRAVKSVTAATAEGAMLWRLARAGVAVLSPHTAFDNCEGGINDGLARRLGLVDIGPLRPPVPSGGFKVVVFAPAEALEAIRSAMFDAGAGRIGGYERCSFAGPGVGSFRGGEGTNPAVGRRGRSEEVDELRVEVVCPAAAVDRVVTAARSAHPYEQPAIDVIPVRGEPKGPGVGRIGRLDAMRLDEFAARTKSALGASTVDFAGDPSGRVERVAIACGAGDDFLNDAIRAGADALLTGEARYHKAIEARSAGIGLVLAGHHATERPGVEDLAGLIRARLPGVESWASRREVDPLRAT